VEPRPSLRGLGGKCSLKTRLSLDYQPPSFPSVARAHLILSFFSFVFFKIFMIFLRRSPLACCSRMSVANSDQRLCRSHLTSVYYTFLRRKGLSPVGAFAGNHLFDWWGVGQDDSIEYRMVSWDFVHLIWA